MTGGTASWRARVPRPRGAPRRRPLPTAADVPPARPPLLPAGDWPRTALALLLVFTLCRGLFVADMMPAFWGPDEDYHFLYADYIVTQRALPSPDKPLYPLEYAELARANLYDSYGAGPREVFRGDPRASLDKLSRLPDSAREPTLVGRGVGVVHPPGYHLLGAAADRLTGDAPMQTRLTWVRGVTALLGVLVVFAAWLLAAQVLRRPAAQLFVAFMVAVQPMVSFLAGIANHDTMLIAFFTLSLALMLFALRTAPRPAQGAWLGGTMAIALATKGSALALLPLAGLTYLGQGLVYRDRWREVLKAAAIALGVVLVLVGWWYVRARIVYGNSTGAVATGTASVGATADVGLSQLLTWTKEWVGLTYRTYWWHYIYWEVPAHTLRYYVPAFVGGVGALGLLGLVWSERRRLLDVDRPVLRQIVVMVAAVLVVFLPFLVIDLQRRANGEGFYVNGGRYLLPAYAAAVCMLALGLRQLVAVRMRALAFGAVAAIALWFAYRVFVDQYLHRYFGHEGFGELLRRISFDRPAFVTPVTLWILIALSVGSLAAFAVVYVRGALREPEAAA